MADVSTFRLNLLRAYYALIAVERAYRVIPRYLSGEPLGPFDGTAYAFWTALALLALLALRYPLQMLPLLFVHLAYKAIWLLGVALPMWRSGAAFDGAAFTWAMAIGVILDLLLIPWGYVADRYVRRPGDPWRRSEVVAAPAE